MPAYHYHCPQRPTSSGIGPKILGTLNANRWKNCHIPFFSGWFLRYETFEFYSHVQGHHDGRLNFLQPGFLIASLDDRPLHRVTETRSAVGAPGTGTSQITQECAVAASGGFDADLYAGKEKNTVDIIYMKPVARLMNNAECSISGHRIQPSIMSSERFVSHFTRVLNKKVRKCYVHT